MLAQQNSVVEIKVNFWHDCDWVFRDLRSQQRVSRYNRRPANEIIKIAAGIDANIPKLCKEKKEKKNGYFTSCFE